MHRFLSPGLATSFRLALVALLPLLGASHVRATVLLESGGAQLSLADGKLRIERAGTLVVEVQAFEFNFQSPKTLAPVTLTPERATLRAVYPSAAKYRDEEGDLTVDFEATTVAGGFRFHARPAWAVNSGVRLRDLDDHYFGILEPLYPDNRRSPDLRGVTVDVEAIGHESQYAENYASAWSPFYMTSHGYASFFDTFAAGRYRLGVGGETVLQHRTGELDWYVFLGRDGDELLASYYRVIGTPKAPPLWSVGPVGWRDENKGGAPEILADVQHLSDLRMPFTAWFVDRPYSDGAHEWSKMNFNAKFAHPADWIAHLHQDYDLKFMSWIGPMTFSDPDFPGQLPGSHGYLDLTDPAAVAEFEHRLATQQYAVGVQGHKMDRADENFPETARWKDGTGDNESRNKYLFLYAKLTHEFLTRAWGDDHYNFARGAVQRTQPFLSALWGGDSRSSWDGLAGNLANAIRCGFLGFPIWGSDTGGYLGGRIDEELYARWLQWGALSGLFEIKLDNLNGTPPDRPPWVYGEKLQAAFRAACEQRMALLPYLFSLSRTSGHTGVLMKPLAYVWPGDPATYAVWDEYLLGPALLVAPLTAPGGTRSVYLPAGTWHDYYDPAHEFAGGQTIAVTSPFEHIPVFVRANSLYVTGDVLLGNRRIWEKDLAPSLTLHVAPGAAGDRTSFELADCFDRNQSKSIVLERTADAVLITAPALGAGGEVQVHCAAAPAATLNGHAVAATYNAATHTARVSFAAGEPIALRFTLSGAKR